MGGFIWLSVFLQFGGVMVEHLLLYDTYSNKINRVSWTWFVGGNTVLLERKQFLGASAWINGWCEDCDKLLRMMRSFGVEFAHIVATVPCVCFKLVIIVVDVLVLYDPWEFNMV